MPILFMSRVHPVRMQKIPEPTISGPGTRWSPLDLDELSQHIVVHAETKEAEKKEQIKAKAEFDVLVTALGAKKMVGHPVADAKVIVPSASSFAVKAFIQKVETKLRGSGLRVEDETVKAAAMTVLVEVMEGGLSIADLATIKPILPKALAFETAACLIAAFQPAATHNELALDEMLISELRKNGVAPFDPSGAPTAQAFALPAQINSAKQAREANILRNNPRIQELEAKSSHTKKVYTDWKDETLDKKAALMREVRAAKLMTDPVTILLAYDLLEQPDHPTAHVRYSIWMHRVSEAAALVKQGKNPAPPPAEMKDVMEAWALEDFKTTEEKYAELKAHAKDMMLPAKINTYSSYVADIIFDSACDPESDSTQSISDCDEEEFEEHAIKQWTDERTGAGGGGGEPPAAAALATAAGTPHPAEPAVPPKQPHAHLPQPLPPPTRIPGPAHDVSIDGLKIFKNIIEHMSQPTNKLHGTIIDGYLKLIQKDCPWVYAMDSGHLTTTFVKQRHLSNHHKEAIRTAQTSLFVMHANDHWTLAFMRAGVDKLYLINSLHKVETPIAELAALLREELGIPLAIAKILVPQQNNSYDCGLFVIAAAIAIAYGLNLNYQQADMPDFRVFVRRSLLRAQSHLPEWKKGIIKWIPKAARGGPILVQPHFHNHLGAEAPQVETRMASEVFGWELGPANSHLAEALTKGTRDRHLRVLALLRDTIAQDPHLPHLPLPLAAVVATARTARALKWSPSTKLTMAGALSGALKRLQQYSPQHLPLDLGATTTFGDYLRLLAKRARRSLRIVKEYITPAQAQQIIEAIRATGDKRLLVAFVTAWSHGARVSNVFRLVPENLTLQEDRVTVLWVDAKTTAYIGPYVTAAMLPRQLFQEFQESLRDFDPQQPLIPEQGHRKAMKALLKIMRETLQQPQLDTRALRRGALIAMARVGSTLETLLSISKHKDVASLRRYIGYGLFEEATNRRAAEATRILLP